MTTTATKPQPATIDYPLEWRGGRLLGPTLIYIDSEGSPIQMELTNDQVQAVIDAWNTQTVLDHAEEVEDGLVVHELKPPKVRRHGQVSNY